MRLRSVALSAFSLLACAGPSAPETFSADAAVERTAPLAIVRSHAQLASRLSRATLTRDGERWTLANAPRAALRAKLPQRAADGVELSNGAATITISALDVASVPATVDGNALVYRDAAAATDLVLSPSPGGVEELRVLSDARAPTTFRWRIQGGAARATAAGVEVLDGNGALIAAAERPWALDANDVRRELAFRVEGDTLIASLDVKGLAFPIVVDPTWSSAGNLRTVRFKAILIALADGKVVNIPNDTAPWPDIFDPATGLWDTTTPDIPLTSWTDAKAIGLADGNVLVVSAADSSFVRLNYPAKTWTTFAATQVSACDGCALTRLTDGRVVKLNGSGSYANVEIFNPATNTWSAGTGGSLSGSGLSNAVTLNDGRVMVIDKSLGQTARLYNVTTGAWASAALINKHLDSQLIKLADGRVMLLGVPYGAGMPAPIAQIYNPATDSWSPTYNHVRLRTNPGAVLLPNGRVMLVGGKRVIGSLTEFYDDAELWDPLYNSWSLIDSIGAAARELPGIANLPNGGVLIAGGTTNTGPTSSAARFTAIAAGASCVAPAFAVTCSTAYCTDGVCCTAASCPGGTCDAPAVAGRPAGTCAKNLGQSCTANADCASNFCVDGVCCNRACNAKCEACNLPPSPGTCRPVLGAPIGARGACTGAGVGTACAPTCNGVDATKCNYATAGTVACGTDSCSGGIEIKAGTCDGAGSCTTAAGTCDPYVCGALACKKSCATESDCLPGYYCGGDKCLPKVGLGASCTATSMCPSGLFCTDGVCCGVSTCGAGSSCSAGPKKGECVRVAGATCATNADCATGFCTDGVCCNRACDGQCEACNLPTTVGTCSPVIGAPLGGRTACGGPGVGTSCAATCNGVDTTKCVYATMGTVACGTDSCADGAEIKAGTCDGAGACATTTAKCDAYSCGATACKRSCAVEADCAAGHYCAGDKCLPKVGLGSPCSAASMCPSGLLCTDGVCCGVASCGEGSSCAAGEKKGVCIKIDGATCTADTDCASKHCADGVCCNRACDGQCEACDVPATRGTCSPVVGAPHGTRAKCASDATDVCKAKACDGKNSTACDGYVSGATVQCKTASCDGSKLVPKSNCDGAGNCITPPIASCGRYSCDPAAIACRTTCAASSDCAEGFSCIAGACSEGARCTGDRTGSIGTDGLTVTCAPYLCGSDGKCQKNCATTSDCIGGAVCDTTSGVGNCVTPPADEGEGGCATTSAPTARGPSALLLVVIGLGLARRRRRATSRASI